VLLRRDAVEAVRVAVQRRELAPPPRAIGDPRLLARASRARDRRLAREGAIGSKAQQARFFGSARRSKSGGGRTLGLASWVWMRSLTRSMGAVAVLAMEPEMPPCEDAV